MLLFKMVAISKFTKSVHMIGANASNSMQKGYVDEIIIGIVELSFPTLTVRLNGGTWSHL